MPSFVTERIPNREPQHDDNNNSDRTLARRRRSVRHCVAMSASACINHPIHQTTSTVYGYGIKTGWEDSEHTTYRRPLLRKTDGRQGTKQRTSTPQARPLAANAIEGGKLKCARHHRRQPRCICLMNESRQTTSCWAKDNARGSSYLSFFLSRLRAIPRASTAETHLGAAIRAAAINCMTFMFAGVWGRG